MPKFKNLRNMKFGRLTVLDEEPIIKNSRTYWNCKCDCGNKKHVNAGHLKNGSIKSCGCLKKEFYNRGSKNISQKHNLKNKRLSKILNHMKQRCYNINASNYKNYGGRGIKICNEWLNNSQSFYDWAKNNGYQDNLSIDRIDVNGDYEPNNCRWATPSQQANNKRNSVFININGKTKTIAEWSRYFGITYSQCRKKLLKKG